MSIDCGIYQALDAIQFELQRLEKIEETARRVAELLDEDIIWYPEASCQDGPGQPESDPFETRECVERLNRALGRGEQK